MSVTRKLLKGMGLSDEQVDTIIEAHNDTVDSLKTERDRYKADADKLQSVQKELDAAQKSLEANSKDSFKVKYDALKEEYEAYKGEQTKKESRAAKEAAYRALLKECGISEKRIDAVLKVSDVDGVELDEKGGIKTAADLKKSVKTEWADFITTTETKGANTATPPANTGGNAMTREDINKIKDTTQRRAAMREHPELYVNERND